MREGVTCALAIMLLGCGGVVGSDEDESLTSSKVQALAEQLERSGADPRGFAAELGRLREDEQLFEILPRSLRPNLQSFLEQVITSAEPDATEALPEPDTGERQASSNFGQRAALLMIANANEKLWVRNLLEWVALSYFKVHMRRHYARVHICIGDRASWDCFRQGRDALGPAYTRIDVFMQTHGFYDATSSTAYDNWNTPIHTDVLDTPHAAHYRYGMFMNCFAARTDQGGFPQAFLRLGGQAAFGAPGLSSPISDMIFESRFGTFGYRFGSATTAGNNHPLERFSRDWNGTRYANLGGMTPKSIFGQPTARVGD